MKGAVERIETEIRWFRDRARTLTVAECEGDADLHQIVVTVLRLVANLEDYRHNYLKVVPWSFSQADSQSGAAAFIDGVDSRSRDEHDPLTITLYDENREALHHLRDTGEVPVLPLVEAVSEVNDTPLDEGAGEGYHRSTRHARVRAYNAGSPYLKQSVRCKSNLKLIREVLAMGPAGHRVVRYEWRFWSRVLQIKPRHQWWRKKMTPDRVFRRIYRMDEMAEVHWSQICTPVRAPGQGPPPKPPPEVDSTQGTDALRIDYLSCVLKPQQWYSVDLKKAGLDEDGAPTETQERQYFQIVQMITSHTKPSLMPTIESHGHTIAKARLALSIQEASPKPGAEDPDGGVVLFEDSDAEWKSWSELGPWHEVRPTLLHYQRAVGCAEHRGCIVVSEPVSAVCPFPLTDLRAPAISMIAELHRRGWRPAKVLVHHDTAAIGAMDSREATKMKAYYVTLLEMDRCFPLAIGGLPSNQPILYYKLLLRGVSVEFGHGHKAYLALTRDVGPIAAAPIAEGSSDEETYKDLYFYSFHVYSFHQTNPRLENDFDVRRPCFIFFIDLDKLNRIMR